MATELDRLLDRELGAEQDRLRAAGRVGAVLHATADDHTDEGLQTSRHAAQHVREDQSGVVELLHRSFHELAPDPVELESLSVLVVLPDGVAERVDGIPKLGHSSKVLARSALPGEVGMAGAMG